MKPFDPHTYEKKWLDFWSEKNVSATQEGTKDKRYILDMFPYPSGAGLHVGHPRGYIATDVLARFSRMKGYSVLHPMGWDAFGLPAENAAIKEGKNPKDLTLSYIENFKRQLMSIGFSYDWERELATTDPSYYAVTQWLFILFFCLGLLDKKNVPVYYCKFCQTGLALEEVLSDGIHERCGNTVEQRDLFQWVFKIPEYAESLLDGIDELAWPEGIKAMQRNWIGKKEGLTIAHQVKDLDYRLETFTAYPALSYADTYIVVAPEHPLVSIILEKSPDHEQVSRIRDYLVSTKKVAREQRIAAEKDKTGLDTGYCAIDPLSGRLLPIWIANFALMEVGTGAIRCSAHDPRDRQFAQKYGIELKSVSNDEFGNPINSHDLRGTLQDSGSFSGRDADAVGPAMADWMISQGFAQRTTSYHLREWIFSRQRYWGEPIPMIYCSLCAEQGRTLWNTREILSDGFLSSALEIYTKKINQRSQKSDFISETRDMMAGWFPVSMDKLPHELPYLKSYVPNAEGKSPLADLPEWKSTICPCCGGAAEYETDTMPNWAGSCWYFLYFAHDSTSRKQMLAKIKEGESPFDANSIKKWLPVDTYVGGAEHAVLHLLYSRFWMHVLNDAGVVDFREPFMSLYNQGMVLAPGGGKMSKSKGNVINPDSVIAEFGADTLRLYEMFMAPFSQEVAWSTSSMQGVHRFLKKVWQIYHDPAYLASDRNNEDIDLVRELQKLSAKIDADVPDVKLNTIISSFMEFINMWTEKKEGLTRRLNKEHMSNVIQLLAPFAPFITEELWSEVLGNSQSVHLSQWPVYETDFTEDTIVTLAIQINGKLRQTMLVESTLSESELLDKVKDDPVVQKWLDGKKYRYIYVKGKVLNFVF